MTWTCENFDVNAASAQLQAPEAEASVNPTPVRSHLVSHPDYLDLTRPNLPRECR